MDGVADEPVDLGAGGPAVIEDAPRQDRLSDNLGWPVAFVGDADELVTEPKGADDLGGGRKKGDDAHETECRTDRGRGQIID
jgi:hypothetical protein